MENLEELRNLRKELAGVAYRNGILTERNRILEIFKEMQDDGELPSSFWLKIRDKIIPKEEPSHAH